MPGREVQLPKGKLLVRRDDLDAIGGALTPGAVSYSTIDDDLRVICGLEPFYRDEVPRLHVSFSHPDRLPDWEMIKKVKQAFFGDDVEALIVLPKAKHYVNRHPYTHHLWESPEAWTDE
jgi:hypothetical protein